ncbi:hypothetical protein GCM10007047_15870 [Cerasicoccus arenae]|uniref:RND efflux pump membrane fusion protein barrel-sandwich domain-containing protein n=1 Tax=Cerasicoccus arenae TaxID=424488 RepID=A0A8J3GE32_9BACT|nr:hypothetical protein GCM10007047_15870 [Cerasicoccus arenae]
MHRDRLLAWLPLYIILAFLGLGWILFGELITPARSVQIVTVVTQAAEQTTGTDAYSSTTSDASADPYAGERLFQASGWIEAAPLPTRATALLDGIVDEVFVLEGDRVSKDQLLATLISEDAEIELLEAQALLAEAEADVKRENALLGQSKAELNTHSLEVAASEAKLKELRDDEQRFLQAGKQAFSARDIDHATLRVQTREAEIVALEAQQSELSTEVEAQALAVETAKHRVKAAQAALQRAELDCSRTEIRSPIDGVVQKLFVAPGQKRLIGMDDPESATIAILYQPEHLQARIDVPLDKAALLSLNQPVILRSNLLPNREFQGVLTRIAGMADIQRNTLQTKVAIHNPDPLLRPDMLCRTEFLSIPRSGQKQINTRNGPIILFVPENALMNRNDMEAEVWTLDSNGENAQKRTVRLGTITRDKFVQITEGLNPGDPVILSAPTDLEAGERVRVSNP